MEDTVGRISLAFRVLMSTTTQPKTGTCYECGESFELPNTFDEVCSETCYYQRKGESALNLLRYDHRLCTCGRRLKETHCPSDDWKRLRSSAYETVLEHGGELHNVDGKLALDATQASERRPSATDAVIGFQSRTHNAETVEKEFQGPDQYIRIYRTGTGCECGITDTREKDDALHSVELATVLANYVKRFRELEREGQLDQKIDKQTFFDTFRETQDITFALGKALHE